MRAFDHVLELKRVFELKFVLEHSMPSNKLRNHVSTADKTGKNYEFIMVTGSKNVINDYIFQ
jgi:hypothetical protein